MIPLKSQAIQTALTGDWQTAIILNLQLLEENPEDIETLNRLAFAYTILGKVKEAKQTYQKVLHLDTQNPKCMVCPRNLRQQCCHNFKIPISESPPNTSEAHKKTHQKKRYPHPGKRQRSPPPNEKKHPKEIPHSVQI